MDTFFLLGFLLEFGFWLSLGGLILFRFGSEDCLYLSVELLGKDRSIAEGYARAHLLGEV